MSICQSRGEAANLRKNLPPAHCGSVTPPATGLRLIYAASSILCAWPDNPVTLITGLRWPGEDKGSSPVATVEWIREIAHHTIKRRNLLGSMHEGDAHRKSRSQWQVGEQGNPSHVH